VVFDIFFTGGTFVDLSIAHLKVMFLNADTPCTDVFHGCNAQGDLLSRDIVVPGPIVGAGLPGLIFASGGLLMLARRRRQKLA
jgi:hypothetical protein